MYIIMEILGAAVTILILMNLLERNGVNVGGLNPFSWARRRKWEKKYHADPAFTLERPMEAVAGLLYVMAKASGDISREQKQCLLDLFQTEFKLDENKARELLTSSAFLLKDEDKIIDHLHEFMKPSIEKFDHEKEESTLFMLHKVAHCEGPATSKQDGFLNKVSLLFKETGQPHRKW